MKKRISPSNARHGPEFKGVVKKITGRLTNRPDLEEAGRTEMLGPEGSRKAGQNHRDSNPDPHRRG